MPIKGMTDQAPSFPQIGVIRKGAPKPEDGKRPGADLQYFRVEFDEEEAKASETFIEKYGNEPTEINILIPFDEIDRNWEAWREAYVTGALIHRCDGENVVYAINPSTGEIMVQNGLSVKTGQPVPCIANAGCKPSGRLRVIVPELRRLAYLMVLTTSIHDIVNISAQLEGIKAMNGGQLRGIPLVLRRRPKTISTPSGNNGKRARREKWLISIEADPKWVSAKLLQIEAASYPALLAPADEDLDESVDAEFTTTGDADFEDEEDSEVEMDFNGEDTADPNDPARWFHDPEVMSLAEKWLFSKRKTWSWALEVLGVAKITDYPGTRETAKETWEEALNSQQTVKSKKVGALL